MHSFFVYIFIYYLAKFNIWYKIMNITEATRKELLDNSKNVAPVKSYGTTRYERRNLQHIYNTLQAFNKVDMNALWRANLLSFILPVHGETDNYSVEFLFEGITDDIKREIERNNGVLEYKCVYRALINAINRQDIYIACSCPDWQYRFSYYSTKGGFNGGRPELRPAKITNPDNNKGIGCKHVMAALANLDWAMKLATTIFNYIGYMEEHYEAKFAKLIFPKLYDISYEEYSEKEADLDTEDDELANAMDNEEDAEVLNVANERGEYEADEEVPEEEE